MGSPGNEYDRIQEIHRGDRLKAAILTVFIISISVLILFTSTDTVTIFSGSHYMSDISSSGNDLSCIWCHSWVQNELNYSSIHSNFKCEECHRMTITTDGKVIKYAVHNSTGIFPGNQTHAAYTPKCMDCHGGNGIYYNDTWVAKQAPPAKAFNETDYGSDYSAHKRLVIDSLSQGMSFGENEACIACHTNYSLEFIYIRPEFIDFKILSDWTLDSISYGSDNSTQILKPERGAKHEFKAFYQIECENCHSDVWWTINHTENSLLNTAPAASHAIWWWNNNSDPMHNPLYIGTAYNNITDYCLSSCHNPKITNGTAPPSLSDKVHVGRRISCYDCHTSRFNFEVENKPGGNTTPAWNSTAHQNFDDLNKVFSAPHLLHGDTCVACKRAGSPQPEVHYRAWTEPNNTIYDVGNGYYI